MLPHVCQAFLDDPHERDLLRIGEFVEVSFGAELDGDAGLLERREFSANGLDQRILDGARHASAVGDLTQRLLERAEAGLDVLEAPANSGPVCFRHDTVDLERGEPNLLREHDEFLQRAVVEVVGKPPKPPLAGIQRALLGLERPVRRRVHKSHYAMDSRIRQGFLENEDVADLDARRGCRSGRKLERGRCVTGAGDAPRTQPLDDPNDFPVPVEENDVDREAHEEHVHRGSAVDQHPAARLEPIAAEEAAHPPEPGLRNLAPFGYDGSVGGAANAHERCTGHRSSMPPS